MSVESQAPGPGTTMARWSVKVILSSAGVALVGGVLWYARAAVVPLIVAALVSTQVLPLVYWAERRGVRRGLAIAASMIGVMLIAAGLALLFTASLFGQLGGVATEISRGVDKVIAWLRDNDSWAKQHEEQIRSFLKGLLPALKDATGGLLTGLVGGLSLAAQLVSSGLLTFVFLLYLLTGGDAIWSWIRGRFSPMRQERVGSAGTAAWSAAGGYIRGIALVALIDSTVIGIGMLMLRRQR